MAWSAIMAEVARDVVRVRRRIKVRNMTIKACRRQILILVVYVTTVASNCLMCPGQREKSRAVVEC